MNDRDGECVDLGIHYGWVDDIALRLSDHQRGFYCDGTLTFDRVPRPKPLRKKRGEKVNVLLSGHDAFDKSQLRVIRDMFSDRPVTISECHLYAAFTIHKGKRK